MNSEAEKFARERLAELREKQLFRKVRGIVRVSSRICEIDGRKLVDFSSNDYMALSLRPELKKEATEWTEKYGTSSGASRLISGTSPECLELEARIAEWKGYESALILSSGFAGNMGAVSSLADRMSAIFSDKLNHASINQGCILSRAELKRYGHGNMNQLRKFLETSSAERKLIVSDTVFSMDGDLAPLKELKEIAERAGAFLYLDDAHGTGVAGVRGKGFAASDRCHASLATFSKAMGAHGACLLSSKTMRDYFINACGPFIFSTAAPPSMLGAISAAVKLIQTPEMNDARNHLAELSRYAKDRIQNAGFDVGATETMIIPIILGDAEKTLTVSARLADAGFLAMAVRPPTVPAGTSRLRLSLNAAHAKEDIDRFVKVLTEITGDMHV